jgi:hypothetical protein
MHDAVAKFGVLRAAALRRMALEGMSANRSIASILPPNAFS